MSTEPKARQLTGGVRAKPDVAERLAELGKFGEGWNDLLQRLLDERETLLAELEECLASHQHCRELAVKRTPPVPPRRGSSNP